MIDTHAHLDDPQYSDDLADVIARAKAAGVDKVLLASVSMQEKEQLHAVEARYPGYCHAMLGIYPENAKDDWREQLELFDEEIGRRHYIAIGEVGMDLHQDSSHRAEQEAVFRHQMAVAVKLGLPVSIHCREAFQPTIDIIREFDARKVRGVWHCFSLTPDNAREIFASGDFYIGIGGVSTFKNARFTDRLSEIPIERVVLETDCPYLAPTPLRGQRNEPSYLTYIVDRLASIYGMTPEDVDKVTTANAKKLFFDVPSKK